MINALLNDPNPAFVSINESSKNNEVSLYPNPASETITLSGIENTEIVILNTLGEVVLEQKLTSSNKTISISTLENGIYLIRNAKGNTVKFIKN